MPSWTPGLFVDNQTHPENRHPSPGTPAKGGIARGAYWLFSNGFVYAEAHIEFGLDMDPGHGEYMMTLPVPCALYPGSVFAGGGYVNQTIAGQHQGNIWLIEPALVYGNITFMLTGLGENHHVRHDNPFPMAPGNTIRWTGLYPKA